MILKNMKIISGLGAILIVCTLLGGGDSMADEKEKNTFTLKEGNETHITLDSMGPFFIKIESNPSTGYSWSLQKNTDETVVKFKGIKEPDQEEEEKDEPPMMGAPSYETFIFDALKPGKTEVLLKYHRPWEKDVPPIKTHKIFIGVKGKG